MKLKTKILSGMLLILLLQAVIGGGFTFYTFYKQAETSSELLITSEWNRARALLEDLKHRHYKNIHLLTFYLQENADKIMAGGRKYLDEAIRFFIGATQADRIVIMDSGRHVVSDVRIDAQATEIADVDLIDPDRFSFPRNEFLLSPGHEGHALLFLVTGGPLAVGQEDRWKVYLITNLDDRYIGSLGFDPTISLAFFSGDRYLLSDAPYFTLPVRDQPSVARVRVGMVPYKAYTRLIATDIHNGLSMVTLKSELGDMIYINRILSIFVFSFLVTLAASLVLATVTTSYFIAPFTSLKRWLDTYLSSGRVEEVTVHSHDEVGFLAKAFHTVVEKVIREEQIIREQLHRISFLNSYNESIVENLQAGIIVADKEGRIEFCNGYFAGLLAADRDDLAGKDLRRCLAGNFSVADPGLDLASLDFGSYAQIDRLSLQKDDQEVLHFGAKLVPLSGEDASGQTLVVLENITSRETLWEKVLVAEKVTSLGMLSAGMAHEINNPLETIRSHLSFLREIEHDTEKLDSLEWIDRETHRIAEIIQRILAYARDGNQEAGKTDVCRVARETAGLLLAAASKKQVQLELRLNQELPPAAINDNELKQVLLNILLNAIQAVPTEGLVRVETARDNGSLLLRVADNGPGIRPPYLRRVFDPFFTTKAQGTGLGLSVAYSIVKHAGGTIRIKSHPGAGTTVEVRINEFVYPHS